MCTPTQTKTLLAQLLANGDLFEVPARLPLAAPAAPPAWPRLIVNAPHLPRALRLTIQDENVARMNAYAAAYAAYVDRFCVLVQTASSVAQVRSLSACAVTPARPMAEPGLEFDGDEALAWDFCRRAARADDADIIHAVHRKLFALRQPA